MTDNPTYASSLAFGMQPSKSPAERASMDDHQFRLAPPMGNFLLSASTTNLLDEKRFPFLRQFLPHPEQMVDLTLDEDEDDEDGEDATETASPLSTTSLHCESPFSPTSSTVVTPGKKKHPWKNVQPWSPLYRKLRQHSNEPRSIPTVDALHADTDSPRSTFTEIEPPPKDSTVPVAEQPEISPEIPETPTVEVQNIRHEENNSSDDGNTPLRSRAATETVGGDSMVAGDGDLEAEEGKSFVRHRPHNEDDILSLGTSQLQRAGQIELIVNINGSNKAPVSIAQCSDQTLVLAAVLTSSLLDLGEHGLSRVDMSRFRTAKVLDKRSGPSGDEYKCELEPVWLAGQLVAKAQMGCDHIRTYEKGLIRARRVGTLRSGKRTFSQTEAS